MSKNTGKTLLMIRKNLTYLRKKSKLTLDGMASECDVSRDVLWKIENNDDTQAYPTLKTLITIADFFDVDISDFISRDMEMEDFNSSEGDIGTKEENE